MPNVIRIMETFQGEEKGRFRFEALSNTDDPLRLPFRPLESITEFGRGGRSLLIDPGYFTAAMKGNLCI